MIGCASHNQRHLVAVIRIIDTAIRAAQPTCRLGIAANWFAGPLAMSGPYTDWPNRSLVSTKPGIIRGGASGNAMCPISASPVTETIVQRTRGYDCGRQMLSQRSTAAVSGACTAA